MSDSLALERLLRASRLADRPNLRADAALGAGSLADQWQFLKSFLREPLTTGAVWPSSRDLAEEIVAGCDLECCHTVVELGPGSGAITRVILDRLPRQRRLLAVEINPHCARLLRQRFPRAKILNDSAENLLAYVKPGQADCVISGLAWGNMRSSTQDLIFNAVAGVMAAGGVFTTFAYAHACWLPTSMRFRRMLFQRFARVETTPVIWRNLPPAFVYRCRQPSCPG